MHPALPWIGGYLVAAAVLGVAIGRGIRVMGRAPRSTRPSLFVVDNDGPAR